MTVSYEIRPAKRSEAKPLIGLYSESGCGKTWSALMLARGFVGPDGRIVMIETEGGRGEAYCDLLPGGYDVLSIRETFAPRIYGEAITAVEKAAPAALIIDSASHEWEGAGGVLSMAAQNQADGKKGPLVWQQPKLEHQRHFMLRLLATPIPLVIVCMRAKYPMQEQRNARGEKEWVRSTTLEPKQADDILFEMFIHGWIDRDHRFQGTKYTREDLKAVIPSGERISIETGKRLAEWARGGAAPSPAGGPSPSSSAAVAPRAQSPGEGERQELLRAIVAELQAAHPGQDKAAVEAKARLLGVGFGVRQWPKIQPLPSATLRAGLEKIRAELKQTALPAPEPVRLPEPKPVDDPVGPETDTQEMHRVLDKWDPPIGAEKRAALFRRMFGTEDLEAVDFAAAQDAIELYKRVADKDPAAITEVNRYLGRSA